MPSHTHWIFLSPHLDDAVLSCGGIIFGLTQAANPVEIWTICAGDPPGLLSPFAASLHKRWGTGRDSTAKRRAEDRSACEILSAKPVHFDVPDCIYRLDVRSGEPLIQSNDDLFGPLPSQEKGLVESLTEKLRETLPEEARLVSPMTLGGHIDHHLVRAAADQLKIPLWYYADYPYAAQSTNGFSSTTSLKQVHFEVNDQALAAWMKAVSRHKSQISTFWGGLAEMRRELCNYWNKGGGCSLWR